MVVVGCSALVWAFTWEGNFLVDFGFVIEEVLLEVVCFCDVAISDSMSIGAILLGVVCIVCGVGFDAADMKAAVKSIESADVEDARATILGVVCGVDVRATLDVVCVESVEDFNAVDVRATLDVVFIMGVEEVNVEVRATLDVLFIMGVEEVDVEDTSATIFDLVCGVDVRVTIDVVCVEGVEGTDAVDVEVLSPRVIEAFFDDIDEERDEELDNVDDGRDEELDDFDEERNEDLGAPCPSPSIQSVEAD